MGPTGRRLSPRNRLERPVEAALRLCGGDTVRGWIVDEQDDGVGMVFGGDDVERVLVHAPCCVPGAVDLWLGSGDEEDHAVPMRLVHLTPHATRRRCRAGLAFDMGRMAPRDVTRLLAVWRRLVGASDA